MGNPPPPGTYKELNIPSLELSALVVEFCPLRYSLTDASIFSGTRVDVTSQRKIFMSMDLKTPNVLCSEY